jgi:dienelactone hydrolase
MRPSTLVLLFAIAAAGAPANLPNPPADRDLREFFRCSTSRLADRCLADLKTLADWQAARPELRKQLLYMLGLDPLPAKTDLHATVTGTTDGGSFVVERLHFQSRPGLYVTANFYHPKDIDKPLPAILYLCGHSPVKRDGVSYGNKAAHQHHAAWFARHGYCCLVLDTLQLGEIEGLHHGTYREKMWWWISRGYTPAGVEAWNAVRALDYLQTRPEVNPTKIGVTGRSGGGAYTWWLAAIDDRPACFVPVAGITDLQNHVVDGCVEGHCDCMYMVNTYGWDFATVAALAAPRPLLFSNSDKDTIFPLDGVYRTHAKLKRIYDLHKAADKLGLLITEGPHKDTQDLQVPAFRWFNRWLRGIDQPITDAATSPFDPKQLKVFAELPADQKNTTAHEWFVPKGEVPLPASRAEWEKQRVRLLAELKDKCLRNWPHEDLPLDAKVVSDKVSYGQREQVIEFTSEENLRLSVSVVRAAETAAASQVALWVAGADDWPNTNGAHAVADAAYAVVRTRATWAKQWDAKTDTHIRRRFVLLGRSFDDGKVWDIRRAIRALRQRPEFKDAKITLYGYDGEAAAALYAGLFEPTVDHLELARLPMSHRDGPTFLNVLRVLDIPQAVALAFPRRVILLEADEKKWEWPTVVGRFYDGEPLQFRKLAPKPD